MWDALSVHGFRPREVAVTGRWPGQRIDRPRDRHTRAQRARRCPGTGPRTAQLGYTGGCATAGSGWAAPADVPAAQTSTPTVSWSVLAATPNSMAVGSATLVRDIDTSGSSDPQHLTAFHGGVVFCARDDTSAGTRMVKDIQAHGSSLYSSGFDPPDQWAVLGHDLYFGVQFDLAGLWRTNGTRAGTRRVFADVYPQSLVATTVRLFFIGITLGCAEDTVVFASDGTSGGTHMVGDAYAADPLVAYGGRAYYAYWFGKARRLFRSSGTWETTGPILPRRPVDGDTTMLAVGRKLFLSQDGGLSISDGTGVGTTKLGDTDSGFVGLVDVVRLGDLWYFPGGFGLHASDLWQTDGTPDATTMASPVDLGGDHDLRSLVRSGSSVWFTAADSIHGRELWRYVP